MLFLNYPSGWKCQQLQGGIRLENRVCLYVWLSPVKWSRIHNSTASFLFPTRVIRRIGKKKNTVELEKCYFPSVSFSLHNENQFVIIYVLATTGKEKRKECPPSCEFLSRLPSWNQGSFSSELMKNSVVIGR